ncbi:repeat protein [Anaerococcus lactolyticus ATCC 51172]|uniref:Repeat protein n=1 Tax=Anaerococcus lactolyticus ATCC 51172 TaxID=525254 RepID=C2BEB1_9FIRM|nr:InlB B-repeat-containing protein [Anaerococcus lactolyticus]EEI86753.1 repeat protein [Anaerococcus lactolyticus ATCC 51172]
MKVAKRILAFVTSLTIVASNITPVFAGKFESEYNDINKDKRYPLVDKRIINDLPNEEIYVLKEGDTITNPDEPSVYTYMWSYKRPVTGKLTNLEEMELASQPYVASVGENASDEEKAKVNYKVNPPTLKGYKKPDGEYIASYDFIRKNASKKEGLLHNSTTDINYEPTINNGIKVKHLFQSLKDRDLYENLEGEKEIITIQKNAFGEFPKTGQRLKLDNLFNLKFGWPIDYSEMDFVKLKEKIKGFEPERNADNLEIIVPEATNSPFVIYYNRKSFQVKINTDGGTYIPDMTLFYGQTIPSVTEIPKKDGAVFDHWVADKDICIKDKSGEITTIPAKRPIDMTKYQEGFQNAMPAEDITFKAIYKENDKAEYSVEFWVEKADYDDKNPKLDLKDKYEFVGNRVLTGKTGTVPDIANISIDGIAFPDLDKARLNKIYKDSAEFDKYFKYNKALTDSQNQDVSNEKVEDDSGESVYKKVSRTIDATGNTSYKIYFDRQVYTLYFSKLITENDSEGHFWPIITKDGEVYDSKKGNPYSFKARFNQNLQGLWPDPIENVKGYPEGYRSLGWVASTKNKAYSYRDTPPYRLTADDFLDSSDIKDKKKGGYSKTLPLGDNGERPLGEREMCFGIDSSNQSEPYQVEFIMETYPGFEVEGETVEKIRDYPLQYRKFDTPIADYDFTPPDIEGFEPKHKKTRIMYKKDKYDFNELNEEDSDRLEEFKTYLKFIGAPREDVKNYKNLYEKKYKIRFLGQFPEKVENDQEEENQEENNEENNQEGNQEDKNKEENNQEKENVQPIEFDENSYLVFEYLRKSYTINFNNDPRKVRDDTSYKDSEKVSVPYHHPLRWLDGVYNFDYEKSDEENKKAREEYDQEHIIDKKRVPEKPKWVPESWKFLGWSLNPEGTTLVKDGNYTMPAHNITLYAKWGCDTDSKVTFDLGLDAGETSKYMIKPMDLKSSKYEVGDDVRTSIKENKKYKLPIEDETSTSGKQVFIVENGLAIKAPSVPRRPGYDFMGWEHVIFKKDDEGNNTGEVDDSFKEKYGPARQYTFESEIYSDVYLKAIWAKNNLYDVKITDHILDKDLNEDKTETKINILENQREGTFAYYFAKLQGENRTLVPDKDLERAPEKVREAFIQYRDKIKEESESPTDSSDITNEINTYYQNVKVDRVECPMAYNQLQFFYKPYRKREYKVNYLLVDNDADLKDTKKYPTVGKPNSNLTKQIIDQDEISNGNRHFDARNYRLIPGFKLVSKPQTQLVFTVNEENNKLLSINGVDVGDNLENAQVNFYYKDIRLIKDKYDKPPKGYHRISFVAKDHGSFGKDENGKEIKEVHYDVIDGLYFSKVHVPTNNGKKDKNDADLLADPGYQIGSWSQKDNPANGLLDPHTVITRDYTFEISFIDKKYPEIEPIKVFESSKNENGYINDFRPKKADYDKALAEFIKMDNYKSYEILDDEKAIYEKLKEDDVYNSKVSDPEPIKTSIKVKISFKDKTSKEFDIPVLVYKNIYRALDDKGKVNILKKDKFLEGFVKVTVDPTDKAVDKQTKTYYVNQKAYVKIPEANKPVGIKPYIFEKWTVMSNNKETDFDMTKHHKIASEIVIVAKYSTKSKPIPQGVSAETVVTYIGNNPELESYKQAIKAGKLADKKDFTEIEAYEITKEPDVSAEVLDPETKVTNNENKEVYKNYATVKVIYKSGEIYYVDIPVKVLEKVKPVDSETDIPKGYEDYLLVTVDPTENATDRSKSYYRVRKNIEVTIPVNSPTGKEGYTFVKWDKDLTYSFNDNTTIKAIYSHQVPWTPIKPIPEANGGVIETFRGVRPNIDDYRKNVKYTIEVNGEKVEKTLGAKDTLEFIGEVNPDNVDVSTLGDKKVPVKIALEDGTSVLTDLIVRVVDKVYPENTTDPIPEGYVNLYIIPTDDNQDKAQRAYKVHPNVDISISASGNQKADINLPEISPVSGKSFLRWTIQQGLNTNWKAFVDGNYQFNSETNYIVAKFVDNVVLGNPDETRPDVPADFVKVIVKRDKDTLKPKKTIYWVKKDTDVMINEVDESTAQDYVFDGWKYQDGDDENNLKEDANKNFKFSDQSGQVSHKFDKALTVITAKYSKFGVGPNVGGGPVGKGSDDENSGGDTSGGGTDPNPDGDKPSDNKGGDDTPSDDTGTPNPSDPDGGNPGDKPVDKPGDKTGDKPGENPKDKGNNPSQKGGNEIVEIQAKVDQTVKTVGNAAGKIAGSVSATVNSGVAGTKKALAKVLNPRTGIITNYEFYLGLMAASSVGLFFTREKKNKDEE